ncbi:MAG: hypothetical protein ACKO97_09070, partial [Actinomycetota bacterium]
MEIVPWVQSEVEQRSVAHRLGGSEHLSAGYPNSCRGVPRTNDLEVVGEESLVEVAGDIRHFMGTTCNG